MTATELLDVLTRGGFSLTPAGEDIRVNPANMLTLTLRQGIRDQKGELLNLLHQREMSAKTGPEGSAKSDKRPAALTKDEEAKILRWIELCEGLPPGSQRFYTQEELRQRFPDKKIVKRRHGGGP